MGAFKFLGTRLSVEGEHQRVIGQANAVWVPSHKFYVISECQWRQMLAKYARRTQADNVDVEDELGFEVYDQNYPCVLSAQHAKSSIKKKQEPAQPTSEKRSDEHVESQVALKVQSINPQHQNANPSPSGDDRSAKKYILLNYRNFNLSPIISTV
ncbi:unnamed protein product [Strongylus vulgaris]|uniref:Uncharacterized protein n=1 Tax=Strongylus vulgaris TaxID=40348 RepID=A0A3P7JPJ5_STRVU|nr:unnamed protein product [Strongylus vulgaris]